MREKLLKELIEIQNEYEKENEGIVNRQYWREHSDYEDRDFLEFWKSFSEFRREAIPEAEHDIILDYEKKIIVQNELIKSLKKDKKKLLKDDINTNVLLDRYEESLKNQKPLKINNKVILPTNKSTILLLSDWHLGEKVKAEEMQGVNHFNNDILFARADRVFGQFIGMSKKIGIDTCHIYIIGDMLTGTIHEELNSNSDIPVTDAIFILQSYLSQKIINLTKYYNSITVVVLSGNHGRLSKKPVYKRKQKDNWEYILGKQLEIQLSGQPKINVIVPESPYYIAKVYDVKFLLTHGDIFSGTGGFAGLPFYSFAMQSAKFYGALHEINELFHHVCIGHFHKTASSVEQTMIVVNDDNTLGGIIRIGGE